jgi:hypothetical protein
MTRICRQTVRIVIDLSPAPNQTINDTHGPNRPTDKRPQLRASTILARIDPPVTLFDHSESLPPMNTSRGRSAGERCYPLTNRRLPLAAARWVHSVQVALRWSSITYSGNLTGRVCVIGTDTDTARAVAGNASSDSGGSRSSSRGALAAAAAAAAAQQGGGEVAAAAGPAGRGNDHDDDDDDDGPTPVMPHSPALPPPGWLESLKADHQQQNQRQRLVLECPLVPNSSRQGGEVRFDFAPRPGEAYHLWCEIDGVTGLLLGPAQMVSAILDDDEGNVGRNYRALSDSGVLRKPRPCCRCDRALRRSSADPPEAGPLRELLAECRRLRSQSQRTTGGNDDRERTLASFFARHGIATTELSLASVEELVLENGRLVEHEEEEQRLLLDREHKRRVENQFAQLSAAVHEWLRRDPPTRRRQRRRRF